MKNIIIKSNEWYDDLSEMKRLSFFLIVIMGSLVIVQYLMSGKNSVWSFPIWASFIAFWRCGYIFIQWYESYKNDRL